MMDYDTVVNLERAMQALQRAWHTPPGQGVKARTHLMHTEEGAGNYGRADPGWTPCIWRSAAHGEQSGVESVSVRTCPRRVSPLAFATPLFQWFFFSFTYPYINTF